MIPLTVEYLSPRCDDIKHTTAIATHTILTISGRILQLSVHHDTDSKAAYWTLGKQDITSVMSRRTFGKDEEWRKVKEEIGMRRSHVRKGSL